MGKSDRVEGPESFHTACGSVGYECSATVLISLLPDAIRVTIKRIILVCNNINKTPVIHCSCMQTTIKGVMD